MSILQNGEMVLNFDISFRNHPQYFVERGRVAANVRRKIDWGGSVLGCFPAFFCQWGWKYDVFVSALCVGNMALTTGEGRPDVVFNTDFFK